MPKHDDIEQLKAIIDSLGDERKIREERGEELEPIPEPEPGLSSELEDLLGLPGEAIPSSAEKETPLSLDDFEIDDISKIVGEGHDEAGGESGAFEDFMSGGTPAAVGSEDAVGGPDETLPLTEEEGGGATPAVEPGPPLEEPPAEEPFSFEDFSVPEEAGESPAENGGFDTSAFGDFELPGADQMADLGIGEEAASGPPQEEGVFESPEPSSEIPSLD
ncbi:MAG TPA: hypothetical protein ENN69_00685, partial [Spirochaetia bacterium]|nr:hypothetical protein [Spirochaetia bacterium]